MTIQPAFAIHHEKTSFSGCEPYVSVSIPVLPWYFLVVGNSERHFSPASAAYVDPNPRKGKKARVNIEEGKWKAAMSGDNEAEDYSLAGRSGYSEMRR